MIRITNPTHQRRLKLGDDEIILDYCAVQAMHVSTIGADVYAHGARVRVVWGTKNASREFVEAEPTVFQEFSLANVREEKRIEYFQRASVAPMSPPATTVEEREVVARPGDHALRDLLTPQPGQANRRFGDVRMRDFEEWLVGSGKIGGVVE